MANPGEPVRVFIVEDNDPDVFLVEEALRSHGVLARIQRCHDGEEAIDALSHIDGSSLPDIIIIDLNLPRVTGLEILKYVRSLTALHGIPVMILTSSQSRTDRARSLELGADTYIAKPPTLPEFLSIVGSGIRGLLERSDAEPQAPLQSLIVDARRLHSRFRTSRRVRFPGRSRTGWRSAGRLRRIAAK